MLIEFTIWLKVWLQGCLFNMKWTPANIKLLRVLWEQGKTGGEIVVAMKGKFSRSAVIGQARRLSLSRRPSPIRKKSDII